MGHILLLRLATLLFALSAGLLYVNCDGVSRLNKIYANDDSVKSTSDSPKCEGVVGRVPDCSECYTCDNEKVTRHRRNGHDIIELKLNDVNCESSEKICCVSQKDLKFRDSDSENQMWCGHFNPAGKPRAVRPSMRAVLPGEYPWRAWIYNNDEPATPLCAATYVNREGRTLLTAASCVAGYTPHKLRVRFDIDSRNHPVAVKKIDVHENYTQDSHVNDIAVLSVGSVPGWAERACLPVERLLHGTACVAVAENGYSINLAIPVQSKCSNTTGTPLDESLMCAVSRPRDYSPEFGGGMYCVSEHSTTYTYTVYGVYLYSAQQGEVVVNTNVASFYKWINNKALEHRFI